MKGELFDRMISLVFPRGCVLCGATVAFDDLVCSKCVPDRTEHGYCLFCGKMQNQCRCGNKLWDFQSASAALYYRDETRDAVLQLKKLPNRRIACYLAGEMFICLNREFPGVSFDIITEVPMHPKKLEKRGFNQTELLAGQLSVISGIFHRTRLLVCSGEETYQHTLNRSERFAAVQNRYLPAGDVKGKTVLLVDDIFTTGATAQACSKCLMAEGAKEVYVLTATATPLNKLAI